MRLALIILGITGLTSSAQARAYGLVIGYNGTDNEKQQALRYADDDAIKNAELLAELGAAHVLLTSPDRDTRSLFPTVEAAPPTKARVRAAIASLNERIRADGAAGSDFYLVYSGHGNVEHGSGYVHLADSRLDRAALRDLLHQIEAETIHVIVDACKSYFLVFERGKGDRRPALGQLLYDRERPLPKNVGFILSTSSAQDSHEWEAYQGGIFSHEVRSAMRGAADSNNDQTISYEETAAFVFAANRSVPNARYRPQFFLHPPSQQDDQALVSTRGASTTRLTDFPEPSRHWYVEDAKGVRLADLHPGENQRVSLMIPARRPLFVRASQSDREYAIRRRGSVSLAGVTWRRQAAQPRGAEHEAFQLLFKAPFDEDALTEYRDEHSSEVRLAAGSGGLPRWLRPALGWAGLGLAVAGGVVLTAAAIDQAGVGDSSSQTDRQNYNERVPAYRWSAGALLGLGAASLAAYAIWTWWPEPDVSVKVVAAPNGAGLIGRF